MSIELPNQVWAADITDIPIGRGFLYLVAIIETAIGFVDLERKNFTGDALQSKGALTTELERAGWNDAFMLKLLGHMR